MIESRSSRWTPQEDDLFRGMADANVRPEIIAAKLNRSVSTIKAGAYTIGLPLKWFRLKPKKCAIATAALTLNRRYERAGGETLAVSPPVH